MRASRARTLSCVLGLFALGLVAQACPYVRGERAEEHAAPERSASDATSQSRKRSPERERSNETSKLASRGAEAIGDSPWQSSAACSAARAARTASAAERRTARIGTWNVRWFPDGGPGNAPKDPGTDIAWLACGIASLDVDVLALQELKALPRAKERLAALVSELDRSSGGRWQFALDDCPRLATQHTGLLWNAKRAEATGLRTLGELNPHGEACKDGLRPGFGGHFRFVTGQSAHVISVHYKSGGEARSLELRKKSFLAMGDVARGAQSAVRDEDVIFAGDFNTMGCQTCSPAISSERERDDFGELLGRVGLAWAPSDQPCSEYYDGKGTLLDGFVVTGAQGRRLVGKAHVAGYCADLSCRHRRREPSLARQRLSDHCPVVLELGTE